MQKQHLYVHPKRSILNKPLVWLCNNAKIRNIRRAIVSRLPYLRLESEVKDIVYINWLIDYDTAKALCSPSTALININGKTLLTALTYRHGHFRPSVFNGIKRLFPSPLQSNWRFYLRSVEDKPVDNAVLFIKNMMNSLLFTVGTRLSSDAMFTHYPLVFTHTKTDNRYTTRIDAGLSNSPDLHSVCRTANELTIPQDLLDYFGSSSTVLAYLCLQDTAYTEVAELNGLCKADISLPIDTNEVIPLSIETLHCAWLQKMTQDAPAFAFVVPKVHFKILGEQFLPTTSAIK